MDKNKRNALQRARLSSGLTQEALAERSGYSADSVRAWESGARMASLEALGILGGRALPASEEDWDAEYDDYILAVRTVRDCQEAVSFINAHGTGHSECIVTDNYFKAQRFLDAVDAAAVYVNASTRFTDGGEFGLGAEIGISTQKMHARGPMGLSELTSCKYVIYGEGQVR